MSQHIEIVERLRNALTLPDVEMVQEIEGLVSLLEEEIMEADRWFEREEELRMAEQVAIDRQCYAEAGIPW